MAELVGKISDLIGAAENTAGTRKVNTELGKDAFLELLVAQLKNQDPMKPMEDTAMIAEMAQFSSLEQMQNLNKLMEKQMGFSSLSQSANMIGKHVTLTETDKREDKPASGVVQEVRARSGEIYVVINDEEYNASNIVNVKDAPPAPEAASK